MNRKVMLSCGGITIVYQLLVAGIVWADIDLAQYEREVVRSDQIQVTIANGSEREFWKQGSLSYSFRLTSGEDSLFLESTHDDNRLMFANSWGGRGCQLIVKLEDPSFAIDGAIQNVGQAVTRPKDTVADEWARATTSPLSDESASPGPGAMVSSARWNTRANYPTNRLRCRSSGRTAAG